MSEQALGAEPPSRGGAFSVAAHSVAVGGPARNLGSRQAAAWRDIPVQAANNAGNKQRKPALKVVGRDLRSPPQLVADIFVIVALGVATGLLYYYVVCVGGGTTSWINRLDATRDFAWASLTVALLFLVLERLGSDRQGIALTTSFDRVRGVARGWSLAFAALLFILFALKASTDLSRGFFLSFYLVGLGLLGTWRVLTPPIFARWTHRLGYGFGEWVVIGDAKQAALDGFVEELTANKRPTPTVIRFNGDCGAEAWPDERRKIFSCAERATRTSQHGEIYLCAAGLSTERLASIRHALSVLPVATYVLLDAAAASLAKCKAVPVGGRVAVEVRRPPLSRFQRLVKRALDVVLSSISILCLSPVFIAIALAIKLDSPGPVLFRQTRRGHGGAPFRIFKFRTMHVLEDGPEIQEARRNDPRVTRIGRFLRSSSVDELPQLLNVLKGEMSLVGPRPHAIALDESYAKLIANYEVRQHVKPGITGWAQAHGLRGETSDPERLWRRIEFDIWYAVNASLLLDCEILIRTVFEVCRKRNAY